MPLVPKSLRDRVARFDDRVDSRFDRLRGNPVSDRVFYGASELGDFSLVWFILGAARGLRSERDWKAAVRVGVGLGVESALVNGVIKSFFRRRRPVTPEGFIHVLPLRRPRTSSFPSGHATSAFSAAALLSEDDALWPLYYGIAVLVATSRVYVKMHHASDIVAGAALGALMGRAARKAFPLQPAPGVTPVSESEVPGRG